MGQTDSPQDQAAVDQSTDLDGADPSLSVLSDLLMFDTDNLTWTKLPIQARAGQEVPLARYAHLSAVTNDCLMVLGGQDITNSYIEQLSVIDLTSGTCLRNSPWQGHAGTYRSIAVSRPYTIRHDATAEERAALQNGSPMVDPDLQLPHTIPATNEPVYTFTNYNFADVRRALDVISAPVSPDWETDVLDLSAQMAGAPSLPPGLRFPTAAMVGSHLILTGTLITQQVSSFAIWTLNLSKAATLAQARQGHKLAWQKVDGGSALRSGSWNRAAAWRNCIVVLGDRDRDIAIDYNRRQNNFTHVVLVDLEVLSSQLGLRLC